MWHTHIPRLFLPLLLVVALASCAPRFQPPGPNADVPRRPTLTHTHFLTSDGTALPLRRWAPETPPRAVIITLHGFNDYGKAFTEIGTWLATQGVATLAYDQRGFGSSPQAGIWPGRERLVSDIHDAVSAVKDTYPDLPVFALGESMGGGVLMVAWNRSPLDVDGLVLVAPAVLSRDTIPAYQAASLWVLAHTMPWLSVSGQGIKRNPSDNIEMLRALGRDPLVIKHTRVDSVWGLVNLMDDALAAASQFVAPSLFLFGANDDIVPPTASRQLLAALPKTAGAGQTIAVYPDGFHMLLRDLQSSVVWEDILTWIDDPTAQLPSGGDVSDPISALPDLD
jgi:acylglycerol lipase